MPNMVNITQVVLSPTRRRGLTDAKIEERTIWFEDKEPGYELLAKHRNKYAILAIHIVLLRRGSHRIQY